MFEAAGAFAEVILSKGDLSHVILLGMCFWFAYVYRKTTSKYDTLVDRLVALAETQTVSTEQHVSALRALEKELTIRREVVGSLNA